MTSLAINQPTIIDSYKQPTFIIPRMFSRREKSIFRGNKKVRYRKALLILLMSTPIFGQVQTKLICYCLEQNLDLIAH